jgi:hypothetical protein
MDNPEYESLFDYYISIGAIEPSGIDETGEMCFLVTETAKEVAPELWKAHKDYVDKTLLDLYEKDLISVEYNENLEATISLTDQAKKIIESKGIIPLE